jgi:hypothetical protein
MAAAVDLTESNDTVPELRAKPAPPSLRVHDVSPSTPPALSTRRRWSVKAMFSSPPKEPRAAGDVSFRLNFHDAIERLKAATVEGAMADDERLLACAKWLLEQMPNHDKVATASKAGAPEAVLHALRMRGTRSALVAHALLPPLINLSAGDDEAGRKRAASLVSAGIVPVVTDVLRAHTATGSAHAADPAAEQLAFDVALRCVWVLQHVCRRSSSSSSLWLAKLLSAETPTLLASLGARFGPRRTLHTRVAYLLADVCRALTCEGEMLAGMASAMRATPHEVQLALLPPLAQTLALDVEAAPIKPGCEVHEAAALALSAALSAPPRADALGAQPRDALARRAIELDVLGSLVTVLAAYMYPEGANVQLNACWAAAMLWQSASAATRAIIAPRVTALADAVDRALRAEATAARLGSARLDDCREAVAEMRECGVKGTATVV